MSIVAMTREMGSLGKDVAEGLARDLGLSLYYHEIIDHLADKTHMAPKVMTRFLQGKVGMIESLQVDWDAISVYTAEEVLDLAAKGNLVIRGWGATSLLRPVSNVLSVRVCAPVVLRARRIMERLGINDSELALNEIKKSDAAHAALMLRRFGIHWHDAEHYDLTLNTERLSVQDCIEQIKQVLTHPAFQESAKSRTELLNLALSTHIQGALRNDPETRGVRISIASHANGSVGNVVLQGIVTNDAEKQRVEAMAFRFPGVLKVDNELRVMTNRKISMTLDG